MIVLLDGINVVHKYIWYIYNRNLRWDALAQILSVGGVYAGAKVLVFETVIGLLVGSCAYRMRGHGKIVALYPGQQPHYVLVPVLNLDYASMSIIEVYI